MAPRYASVETNGGVSRTTSGPRPIHGKADAGCRLVQECARSERTSFLGLEISASAMTSARGMSVPGVLTTLRARGGASSGTRMCMTRQVLQAGDSGASFACPRWVWMPWFLKPASNLSGVTSRFVWLQTKCTAFRSESALRLGQTFCKQNVWHFVECKVGWPFSTRNQTKCTKHFVCVRFIECKLWPN